MKSKKDEGRRKVEKKSYFFFLYWITYFKLTYVLDNLSPIFLGLIKFEESTEYISIEIVTVAITNEATFETMTILHLSLSIWKFKKKKKE